MATDSSQNQPPRIALVMSGGGARGAYEAGVLSYILDDLAPRLGRPVRFDIVTGASVGGIHACYVAAAQEQAGAGAKLAELWQQLSVENVFTVGTDDVLRLPSRLLGLSSSRKPLLAGLFDTRPLQSLILDHIPWSAIRRQIDKGRLEALALAATEVETGRTVVFIENATGTLPAWTNDPFVIPRAARIDATHAMASAAIPLLFRAVRIGKTYYSDGGLRMNTPLVPALRLGADRVLIIGLRHRPSAEVQNRAAVRPQSDYTSLPYLAGKALNALLLDRIDADVERLRLFNALLESGQQTYGPEFIERINEPIVAQRNTPYRIVHDLYIQPSQDLGEIAADCLHNEPPRHGLRSWVAHNVTRLAAGGALLEADLLSYIYFDRAYTQRLLELGRRDAARRATELETFLS